MLVRDFVSTTEDSRWTIEVQKYMSTILKA